MVFGLTRRSRAHKEIPSSELLFLQVIPEFLLSHEEHVTGEKPEPLSNRRSGITAVVLDVERLLSEKGFPFARREIVEQDHYFRATLSYDGLTVEYEIGLQPFFSPDLHESLQPVPEEFRRRHDRYYDGSFDIVAPVMPFPLAKELIAQVLESHRVEYNPRNTLSGPLEIRYVSREHWANAGRNRPEGLYGKPVFDKLGLSIPEDIALHQSDGAGYRIETLRAAQEIR